MEAVLLYFPWLVAGQLSWLANLVLLHVSVCRFVYNFFHERIFIHSNGSSIPAFLLKYTVMRWGPASALNSIFLSMHSLSVQTTTHIEDREPPTVSQIIYCKLKHGGEIGPLREAVRGDGAVSILRVRPMKAYDEAVHICLSSASSYAQARDCP